MRGIPVDMWVERRAFGRRGTRIAAAAMAVVVVSMPLAFLAVSFERRVQGTAWTGILALTALFAVILGRYLLLASRPAGAFVTSLSYVFAMRMPEAEVEALVRDVLRAGGVTARRVEIDGFPAWVNDDISVVVLAGGRLPGAGGLSVKDHTGDNVEVLRAFHREASERWGLDRAVANGKRVVPRRRAR